jgi:hypothetical protein
MPLWMIAATAIAPEKRAAWLEQIAKRALVRRAMGKFTKRRIGRHSEHARRSERQRRARPQ